MRKITCLLVLILATFTMYGQCDFTLELNDNFGDGWNGNSIDIIVNGTVVLDNATLDDGSQGTVTFQVSTGDEISFTVDDSGSFDNEVSYRILNNQNIEVATGDLTNVPEPFNAVCVNCTLPEFTQMIANDCDNEQFSVEIVVSDIGSASSYVISNNLNEDTVDFSEAGTYIVGPFDSGSEVLIFIVGDNDDSCALSTSATSNCPPSNDNCVGAIPVTDGTTFEISTEFATEDVAGCDTSDLAKGVWFFINDGGEAIEVTLDTFGSTFDTELSWFTGTCEALVCGGNNDDTNGVQSEITFTTNGDGENIYILATGFSSSVGDLVLNVSGAGLLSTGETNELEDFSMYPNPTQNELNISSSRNIESVTVFNLAGQKVMDQTISRSQAILDTSALTSGVYLMQVIADGQTGTYKFVKQ